MKRLGYVRFGIPDGKANAARELLAEMGLKVPASFDNEASDVLATSHALVISQDQVHSLLSRLFESGIDERAFTRSERKFTSKEMAAAKLFWVHVQKQKGDGYTVHGGEYDTSTACSSCGSGVQQAGPLTIDCAEFGGVHLGATYNLEIVASADLCEALKSLTGARFADVVDSRTGQVSAQFRQVIPVAVLPDLVPPTRLTRSSKYCPRCSQNGLYLDSEIHIGTSPEPSTDFYRTRQLFGEMRERACPGPELVFSWRVLELVRDFDRRALKQEPVYVGIELLTRD